MHERPPIDPDNNRLIAGAPRRVAVALNDVSKAFGATRALDHVSLEIVAGTIHALVGGNGSGKSTLIKVLAGVHRADSGTVMIGGRTMDARSLSPAIARAAGVHFVHQQPATFDDLTVAENLAIGRGFTTGRRGVRIRWRLQRRHAASILERFGIEATPRTTLREMSQASRTLVAIARALQDQDGAEEALLVLDEPTASLPSAEVDSLLSALQRFASQGQAILYVSHRLEEVVAVADHATVLRDGRQVATVARPLAHDRLVELMMGRTIDRFRARRTPPSARAVVVDVSGLFAGSVKGVSFRVHAGETVGIAGPLGSGRSTLLRALFGDVAAERGTVCLRGETVRFSSPRQAMSAGVAYVPEDRAGDAAFADLSITENLGMTTTARYFHGGRLRRSVEARDACGLVDTYLIKTHSLAQPISSLSGGNQQKVILARWLRLEPRLILLDEPTQGVDVGARLEIWELLQSAIDAGAGALVVSSDFEELPRVCDRVLVLKEGRLVGELCGEQLTEEAIDTLTLSGSLA
jgi:ribose transport system ATP-binding protein